MPIEPVLRPRFDNGEPIMVASFVDDPVQLTAVDSVIVTEGSGATLAPVVSSDVEPVMTLRFDVGEPIMRVSFLSGQPTGSNDVAVNVDVENGNIDAASVTITNGETSTPTIEFTTNASIFHLWRHFVFEIDGLSGKSPIFRISASNKDGVTYISDSYRPVLTLDRQTWTQADDFALTNGVSGDIEFSFPLTFGSGVYTIASSPYWRDSDADAFATLLLSAYSSVASPTSSANASGVYATTASVNNVHGNDVGGNNQYAIKLDWGGATTDGNPKRVAVFCAGIGGAGSAHSDLVFKDCVMWMLDDLSQSAQSFRANFDVYLYFNINPDSVRAGEPYHLPNSVINPNRSWNVAGNSALQIITDVQDAIIADTSSEADMFVSFYGAPYSIEDGNIWLTDADHNPHSRSLAMHGIIHYAAQEFINTPDVSSSTAETTDVYWGRQRLGARASFGIGVANDGLTTLAHYQSLAEKWMNIIQTADAQGAFRVITGKLMRPLLSRRKTGIIRSTEGFIQ